MLDKAYLPPESGVRNFRLDDFLLVNRKLAEYRQVLHSRAGEKASSLDHHELSAMWWLKSQLDALGLQHSAACIAKAIDLQDNPDTPCSTICHYFDEAITDLTYRVSTEWTYHYGPRTQNIGSFADRWGVVLSAFPSSRFEIESALDLFALQHYTASVFHFMRAAEHGLRVLANELGVALPKGKPISHGAWQEIIAHCDRQLKQIGQTAPAGDAKDKALAFYSAALSHLHYLKDNFRNDVMHTKSVFDIDAAIDASVATKKLLELLASRLSERTKKKGFKNGRIDWGF